VNYIPYIFATVKKKRKKERKKEEEKETDIQELAFLIWESVPQAVTN